MRSILTHLKYRTYHIEDYLACHLISDEKNFLGEIQSTAGPKKPQVIFAEIEKNLFESGAVKVLIIVEIMKYRHDKALEIANSILQRVEDVTEAALPTVLIAVYRGMGLVYTAREEAEKMIEVRKKGLEIALKYFGEDSPLAFEFSNQATKDLYASRSEEALPYAKQHLEIALKVFPKNSKEVAESCFMLGNLHSYHKNRAKALASFEEALKFYERSPQKNLEALGTIYRQSVFIYSYLQDFKGAANLLPKIELYKSFEPRDDELIFELYYILSHIAYDEKDLIKTYKMYKECEKIRDETQVELPLAYELDVDLTFSMGRVTRKWLSAICMALGKTDEAEKYIQKVLQTGYFFGMVGPKYQILANGFEKRGLLKEALDYYKKANEEYAKVGERMNKDTVVKLLEKISELESKLRVATK